MIDVVDRVPTRAGRVKITHADGTSEYVTMERADEPVTQGTPINKTLFDGIQNWFLDLTKDTEKFIPVTVTNDGTNNYLTGSYPIDPYVVGRRLGLLMPVCYSTTISTPVIPALTSDDDQDCVVTGTFNNGFTAFDNDTSTYAYASASSSSVNTLVIKFPKVKLTGLTITYRYSPSMTLYGSSDNGTTWETIGTVSSTKASTSQTLTIANKEYNAIKLEATGRYSSSYSTIYIYEIAVSGYKGIFNPSMPSYININNLGNVLIDEDIEVEKAIQLYYTGTSFAGVIGKAVVLNNNFLSVKTGTISHEGTIPQTSGFSNYLYFVSPNSAGADSAEDNSYEADGNGWSITCSVDQSTRVVTSRAVSKTRRDSSNTYTGITTNSAVVNYLEIAWN